MATASNATSSGGGSSSGDRDHNLQILSLIALDCDGVARSAVSDCPDTAEGVAEAKARLGEILRVSSNIKSALRERGVDVSEDAMSCHLCGCVGKIWIWSYCKCVCAQHFVICQTCRSENKEYLELGNFRCNWCEQVDDGKTLADIASCHVWQEGMPSECSGVKKPSAASAVQDIHNIGNVNKFLSMMGDATAIVGLSTRPHLSDLIRLARRLDNAVYTLRYDMRPNGVLPVCKECDETFPGVPSMGKDKTAMMWQTCKCGDTMLCGRCLCKAGYKSSFSKCFHCDDICCFEGRCEIADKCSRDEGCEAIASKDRGFQSIMCRSCIREHGRFDVCYCWNSFCPTCVPAELTRCIFCRKYICDDCCPNPDEDICRGCQSEGDY